MDFHDTPNEIKVSEVNRNLIIISRSLRGLTLNVSNYLFNEFDKMLPSQ